MEEIEQDQLTETIMERILKSAERVTTREVLDAEQAVIEAARAFVAMWIADGDNYFPPKELELRMKLVESVCALAFGGAMHRQHNEERNKV